MNQPVGALKRRVSTAELRAALENALGRRSGTRQPIAELERRPTPYSTSFAIEELGARLADGTTLELMFKDLSRQALLGTARRIRPAFVYSPLREIETYRTRSEEHTSELQSRQYLVCRLLLEKKKNTTKL